MKKLTETQKSIIKWAFVLVLLGLIVYVFRDMAGPIAKQLVKTSQQYHRHKGNSSVHPVERRQHAAIHLTPASGYPCPVRRWLDRKCRDPEDPIRFPGRTYVLLLLRSHVASVYKSEKPERQFLHLQESENGLHDRDV